MESIQLDGVDGYNFFLLGMDLVDIKSRLILSFALNFVFKQQRAMFFNLNLVGAVSMHP